MPRRGDICAEIKSQKGLAPWGRHIYYLNLIVPSFVCAEAPTLFARITSKNPPNFFSSNQLFFGSKTQFSPKVLILSALLQNKKVRKTRQSRFHIFQNCQNQCYEKSEQYENRRPGPAFRRMPVALVPEIATPLGRISFA
jgi:hypothetical protein